MKMVFFFLLFPVGRLWGFPGGSDGKESACSVGDLGSSLCWEAPLGKEMETHSIILAWRIPWTKEPGGLQPVGLQSRTRLSDSHTQKIMASASFAAWTPRPMCFFWLTRPVFPPVSHPQG